MALLASPSPHGGYSASPHSTRSDLPAYNEKKVAGTCYSSEADAADDLISLAELLTKQKAELRVKQEREEKRRVAKLRQEEARTKGSQISHDTWRRPSSFAREFQKVGRLPVKYLSPREQVAAVRPDRSADRRPPSGKGPFKDVSSYPQIFPDPKPLMQSAQTIMRLRQAVPSKIRISGRGDKVDGVYILVPYVIIQDYPIWRKDPFPMVIHTRDGKWHVSSPEQVEEQQELQRSLSSALHRMRGSLLETSEKHTGRFPQLMRWGLGPDNDFQLLDDVCVEVEQASAAPPLARASGDHLGDFSSAVAPEPIKKPWLPTYGTPREMNPLTFVDERLGKLHGTVQ